MSNINNGYDRLNVVEMANHLVEVEQKLADLKVKYQQLKNITLFQRSSTNLTPSQNKKAFTMPEDVRKAEVLRDTEYQIRRMEDAIQELYNGGFLMETAAGIQREWNEVKKILESYG